VRLLFAWIAVVLLCAYGVAEGLWAGRWLPASEADAPASRLAALPLSVGEWDGQAQELDARQLRVGSIRGYVMRQYVHRRTGETISVLIVCGRPGPIAVHSPEVCYGGAGYEQVAAKQPHSVRADALPEPADFWSATFQKTGAARPDQMRILWSWNATGKWTAAENPRFQFARHPALYKLYVTRRLAGADEPLDNDPAVEFLRLFLPQAQQALFGAS
jgi:hypothetical protein